VDYITETRRLKQKMGLAFENLWGSSMEISYDNACLRNQGMSLRIPGRFVDAQQIMGIPPIYYIIVSATMCAQEVSGPKENRTPQGVRFSKLRLGLTIRGL
jgi:hypothetical protein